MAPAAGLVDELSSAWEAEWPETPPIAFLLRSLHPDLWVRFHSLPESKRYAETDAEYATVLSRHHAVLDALGPSSALFVISPLFTSDPPGEHPHLPGSVHWRTVEAGDYFEKPAQLYVNSFAYASGEFDDVLRAAADWRLANIIVGPRDLRWLYHPYDGGADVIASSTGQRDQLREDFAGWLSPFPSGL